MALKYKWGKIGKSEWSKRFPFALVANVHALPRALRVVGVDFAGDRITVITLDGFQHFLFSVGGFPPRPAAPAHAKHGLELRP